jgi:hypothetical protein
MVAKKVNVSINPDTMKVLSEMRLKLSQDLGFIPSYSQVIQHLLKVNEIPTKGDANGTNQN